MSPETHHGSSNLSLCQPPRPPPISLQSFAGFDSDAYRMRDTGKTTPSPLPCQEATRLAVQAISAPNHPSRPCLNRSHPTPTSRHLGNTLHVDNHAHHSSARQRLHPPQHNTTAPLSVIIQCAAPTVSGEMMAPGIVDVDQMLTPFRCIPSALGIHDPISAHPTLSSPYQGPGGPADGRRIGDKLMVFAVLLAGALSWVGACSSSTTGRQRQSLDTRC